MTRKLILYLIAKASDTSGKGTQVCGGPLFGELAELGPCVEERHGRVGKVVAMFHLLILELVNQIDDLLDRQAQIGRR